MIGWSVVRRRKNGSSRETTCTSRRTRAPKTFQGEGLIGERSTVNGERCASIELPPRERDEERLEARRGEPDVQRRAAGLLRRAEDARNCLAGALGVRRELGVPRRG